MSKSSRLTKESVLAAIAGGARNMTQVAHAHGYVGNVSGDVTKAIRRLVPKVDGMLADAKAGKVPAVEARPEAKAQGQKAVIASQEKETYRGLYGAVYSRAVAAGEVPVREFVERTARDIAVDPACAGIVGKLRAKYPDADLVEHLVKATTFAIGVIRTPKHRSNMNRSFDASAMRGSMKVVAVD